jgi:hypothetical protein
MVVGNRRMSVGINTSPIGTNALTVDLGGTNIINVTSATVSKKLPLNKSLSGSNLSPKRKSDGVLPEGSELQDEVNS